MVSLLLVSHLPTLTSALFAQESTILAPSSSPAAQRALEELLSALQQQDWTTALDLAEEVGHAHPRELFQIEEGWFVSAVLLRRWCLGRVGAAAPQEHQRHVQAEASRLSAALEKNPSSRRATLQTLADQYPGTQQAGEAELELGDDAWREGKLDEARRCWSRIPVKPNASSSEHESISGEALLRLGMCDVVEGRLLTAQRIQQRLSGEFPTYSGRLGDESGLLPDLLQHAVDNARGNAIAAPSLELAHQRHRVLLNEPDEGMKFPPPASVACSARGVLIVSDINGIRALDAQTGQPAWPVSATEDRGFLYVPSTPTAGTYVDGATISFTGLIDGEDWYGGQDPVVDAKSQSVGFRRLIDVDLRAEGRLRWIIDPSTPHSLDVDTYWLAAVWTSAPIPTADFIYAAVQSLGDKNQAAVAVVGRQSGLIERRVLLPEELLSPDTAFNDELLVLDDRLLWLHGPWLLCLPAKQEGVHWIRRLDRADVRRGNPCLKRLAVTHGQPCVALEHSVIQFDLDSGKVLWNREKLSPLSGIIGYQDDLLVAAGEHVWGIDLFDGTIRWRAGGDDITRTLHGPACLQDNSILWMHADELWTLDARAGRVLQRLPAEQIGLRNVQSLDLDGNLLRLSTPHLLTTIELVGESQSTKVNP